MSASRVVSFAFLDEGQFVPNPVVACRICDDGAGGEAAPDVAPPARPAAPAAAAAAAVSAPSGPAPQPGHADASGGDGRGPTGSGMLPHYPAAGGGGGGAVQQQRVIFLPRGAPPPPSMHPFAYGAPPWPYGAPPPPPPYAYGAAARPLYAPPGPQYGLNVLPNAAAAGAARDRIPRSVVVVGGEEGGRGGGAEPSSSGERSHSCDRSRKPSPFRAQSGAEQRPRRTYSRGRSRSRGRRRSSRSSSRSRSRNGRRGRQ